MNVLVVYTRLYGECLRKALVGIRRNAWTLLLPVALLLAWDLSRLLSAQLGPVGGIVAGLLRAALVSCYLYFVGEVVAHSSVKLSELSRSIGAYFWAVINVYFVFWVVQLLIGLVAGPSAGLLLVALWLVSLLALNALPETLYQRGTYGGLATIQESFRFLQENWVEWLLPNALLVGALYALLALGPQLPVPGLVVDVAAGVLLHVAMVFRGHLFQALSTSSHRQRMFRYRETER